jgi:hypothetical protein
VPAVVFDRRALIPVQVARCSCCRALVDCVRIPVVFGPYQTTIDLCEVCLKVSGAAFDVVATIKLEDAITARAARRGSPS